jgi:ribokinase
MPSAGAIVHASEVYEEAGGGGAVVARQLTLLNGQCDFFTALGDDPIGHASLSRLRDLDMDIQVQWTGISRSRRAWTHIDSDGERTITVLGDKLLPAGPFPLEGYDLVFFVSGDVQALRSARAARFLAATVRELSTLRDGGVPIDLIVASASDPGERYDGSLDARLVVETDGARGGRANGERYAAVAPEQIVDTYGAGDSFAAAVAFALARGETLGDALELGARAGAAVIGGRGPYASQLAFEA